MKRTCLVESFDYSGDGWDVVELFSEEPHMFFLDSSMSSPSRGRYSLIGFDPFDIFSKRGGECLADLRGKFNEFSKGDFEAPGPMAAGIVGVLSYDLGLKLENIRRHLVDDLRLPDAHFGFYDCVLTVDHQQKKLYVTSTGLPEKAPALARKRAEQRLRRITERLEQIDRPREMKKLPAMRETLQAVDYIGSNYTRAEYITAIEKALDHIHRGDIYQLNLSQRYAASLSAQAPSIMPWKVYQAIRRLSPSCFGGYLNAGTFQIVSSSPEEFLNKRGRSVETSPMKGTRPRGNNASEDVYRKSDLLNSPKETAELLMVTDLERNDLGRVCAYGSVRVESMRSLEEYATVFQTTSTIKGILRDDQDCFDVLRHCFPSGSVTGCPKIRAMEIIEKLEPHRRGIYTGSLGYVGFNGDMNFNVLIRSMLFAGRQVYFHVGGGIVADSTPEQEYEETLIKAAAMRRSLDESRWGFSKVAPERVGVEP